MKGCAAARLPRRWRGALFALCLLPAAAPGAAPLQVVTTTTDLQSLAQAVGGERVAVRAIVAPGLDAEAYQPRPQDLSRLAGAALVVRVGVDYDLWLDRLLAQTGRRALMRGGERHVDASLAIALLDVRGAAVGPGHPHGSGNPHYWLDPANAEIVTATLLEALARTDPVNSAYYERRRAGFIARLRAREQGWARSLAALQGLPLIAHHNDWAYFARRFRLNFAGYVEIRPGVPPSPAHLAGLLATMREQKVRILVRQPQDPQKDIAFLAQRGGARVVTLAASVGALPGVDDYLALIEYNVAALARAAVPAP